MENQAGSSAIPRQSCHEIAAPWRGFGRLDGHALAGKDGREERDPGRLVAGWVRRVDGQVLAEELDRLLAERGPVDSTTVGFAHLRRAPPARAAARRPPPGARWRRRDRW